VEYCFSLVVLVAPLLLNTDDHRTLHYQHFILSGEAVSRTMHGHEPTACPDNALGILNTSPAAVIFTQKYEAFMSA